MKKKNNNNNNLVFNFGFMDHFILIFNSDSNSDICICLNKIIRLTKWSYGYIFCFFFLKKSCVLFHIYEHCVCILFFLFSCAFLSVCATILKYSIQQIITVHFCFHFYFSECIIFYFLWFYFSSTYSFFLKQTWEWFLVH